MKRGISIVEMLFYVALLTFLLIVVVQCVIIMVTSYRNIKSSQVIESSGVAAMDRMVTQIRNATSVDSANSTLGSSPGILTINTSGSPSVIKFDGSTSTLAVYEGGTYSGPLLSRDASVKSLVFRSINTGISTAVKIELEIQSGTSTFYKSKKFYDTAILRGSY